MEKSKKSIYVAEFMGKDEENADNDFPDRNKDRFERKKTNFDIKKIMSEFVVK